MNFNIFPISIQYYHFTEHEELKSSILNYNYSNVPKITNSQGTISYFQSYEDLSISFFKNLNLPIVKRFKEFCLTSALDYAKNICEFDVDRMICSNSWVNFYNDTSGQRVHSHTNSIISSNYFLQFSENSEIKFWNPVFMDNPSKNILQIKKVKKLTNPSNYDWTTLPSNEGNLVFFPSWLCHSVDSTNNNNRVSISMNYVPKTIINESYGFEVLEN